MKKEEDEEEMVAEEGRANIPLVTLAEIDLDSDISTLIRASSSGK